MSTLRARSGSRRALGVAAALAKRGYRPDLRAVRLSSSLYFRLLLPSFPYSLGFTFVGLGIARS